MRNGAPFKGWDLPPSLLEVKANLEGGTDGDRQFVAILRAVRRYSLDVVAEACSQALSDKTVSSDVILAILSRKHEDPQPGPVQKMAKLPQLTLVPIVDCRSMTSFSSEVPMGLRERIMEALTTLGLYGMKATFDEVMAAGIKSRATSEKILCDLLETEMAERKMRSIRYRMGLQNSQWTRT